MSNKPRDLGRISISGSPFQIGRLLGEQGKDSVHENLLGSDLWKSLTDVSRAADVEEMGRLVRAHFPSIWEELKGMAEGLDLPLEQVVAWNCRGDLLASTPDGCTTIVLMNGDPIIAHNEDGLPFFRNACFIADVSPDDGPGFTSFCYPGSIPGHTFAVCETGMVQTVNNLRLSGAPLGLPRMVLGRAILAQPEIDSVITMLSALPARGGFHVLLAQHNRNAAPRIVSIEFGAGTVKTREIETAFAHANHALLLEGHQVITASSHDRQKRAEDLLQQNRLLPLEILRDTGGGGLPIRRDDPQDPDNENTLATAVFEMCEDKVKWTIYDSVTDDRFYAIK